MGPALMAMELARTAKEAFRRTWFAVWVCNIALCPWVAYCLHEFAGVPYVLGYPLVGVFSLFEQFSWPVVAWLRWHLIHTIKARPILWTPMAVMALDAIFPKLFPSTAGIAAYRIPWLIQAADFTGVWGLTALLVATNEAIAFFCIRDFPKAERRKQGIAVGVFLLLTLGYGAMRLKRIRSVMESPHGSLRIAMIQPNVNSLMKVKADSNKDLARSTILAQLLQMTKTAMTADPDFVLPGY